MPVAVRLKHVNKFRDRSGRLRCYLRIPGRPSVALPGEPGSPEFMAAYQRAVEAATQAAEIGAERTLPGSLDALAVSYYRSPEHLALRASTRAAYRRIVEELRADYGRRPVRLLEPRHIVSMMAEKSEAGAPTAANHRLRMLRALMAHARTIGLVARDPTAEITRAAYRTDGYHSWTEEEIAAYAARWPSGSRERLAFVLLLYTGQRRSDVVRMGRQHDREVIVEGVPRRMIDVVQVKTRRRVLIPVHPVLAAELDQQPRDRITWLLTESGKPFSPRGFYNWFRERARLAGLPPGRSPHGLRKAAGRRLAEGGATAHQIMSILGVTLQTAEIYTRAAEQTRLAVAGMSRIAGWGEG